MKTKLIKLALSFFSSDDGRKFVRNVAVVIILPFSSFVFNFDVSTTGALL